MVKNPPANAEDTRNVGLIPGFRKMPRRRKGQPTPVFFLRTPHGQRSLGARVHGVTKNWTRLSDETAAVAVQISKAAKASWESLFVAKLDRGVGNLETHSLLATGI